MRLWHIDLIPFLPKSQLLAQKRECDLIWNNYNKEKQTKHILINYIYNYDIGHFYTYYCLLAHEFVSRDYKFRFNKNVASYNFSKDFKEHNNEYLLVCFMNLYEKYVRGQKDFDTTTFCKLYDFVNAKFDLKSLGINRG